MAATKLLADDVKVIVDLCPPQLPFSSSSVFLSVIFSSATVPIFAVVAIIILIGCPHPQNLHQLDLSGPRYTGLRVAPVSNLVPAEVSECVECHFK